MKIHIEQPWIEEGYKLFSKEGPSGLKIDKLARQVGISRSSFYHHFADLDVFQEKLLVYHAGSAIQAAEKVGNCKVMEPDFLLLIIEEKDYILFNRQLRINREIPTYKEGFESAIGIVSQQIWGIWIEMAGMKHKPDVAKSVFKMTVDIFFHRITVDNFTYEWLKDFLNEIREFIKEIDSQNLSSNHQ